jgi:two-component system cell cycle sensor histidine kinase/response regulator CckA
MIISKNTLDKSINLKADYFEVPALINADSTQIEQVLLNFCINAGHAMTIMRAKDEKWGGDLVVSLEKIITDKFFYKTHAKAEESSYWFISVKDSGVGMDTNIISKIFNPFFTTKEHGKGSVFKIYLPVLYNQRSVLPQGREGKVPLGEGLILIVDDEESIRTIAERILIKYGYDVVQAKNGREAVEIYKKDHVEIKGVLLDMSMPVMSGKEAYIKMKAINPELKVLLASGFRQDDRVEEVIKLGVNGFIQKPYTLKGLARAMFDILDDSD